MRLHDHASLLRNGASIGSQRDTLMANMMDEIDLELAALPAEEPATCDLCKGPVSDSSDHGLGECAPICPTCDGSGVADEPAPASAAADHFFDDARKRWPPMGNGRREGEPAREGIEWLAWFCGKLWEVGVAPPGDSRLAAEIAGIIAAERARKPDDRDATIAELREKLELLRNEYERNYGMLLIAKEREEKRADAAESELASARKEGLRELRETCVSQRERWERIGDWARVHEIEWFMRSIDRLLAADTAPSKPEPCEPGRVMSTQEFEDMRQTAAMAVRATKQTRGDWLLRDCIAIVEGANETTTKDEALAELCRRALGVTGTVGKEAGDGS